MTTNIPEKKRRFIVMCVPGNERDDDPDPPGWWFVHDTHTGETVWPDCECRPSPLQETAAKIAAAYNETVEGLAPLRLPLEGPIVFGRGPK